jgi:hypothetical protein
MPGRIILRSASDGTFEEVVAAGYSDDFNRGDGGLGANWTSVPGKSDPAITSNEVTGDGSSPFHAAAYYSAGTFSEDQYSQVTIKAFHTTLEYEGPIVRAQTGAFSFYYASVGTGGITIKKQTAGTSNALDSGSTTYSGTISVDDEIKLTISGSSPATLTVYQNDIQRAQGTDDDYTTGKPGLWCYKNTVRVDDWEGGDL